MKAGRRDRSTMRGSAKAFGSRALKRPSRRQQFVWRKLEVLQLPKKQQVTWSKEETFLLHGDLIMNANDMVTLNPAQFIARHFFRLHWEEEN